MFARNEGAQFHRGASQLKNRTPGLVLQKKKTQIHSYRLCWGKWKILSTEYPSLYCHSTHLEIGLCSVLFMYIISFWLWQKLQHSQLVQPAAATVACYVFPFHIYIYLYKIHIHIYSLLPVSIPSYSYMYDQYSTEQRKLQSTKKHSVKYKRGPMPGWENYPLSFFHSPTLLPAAPCLTTMVRYTELPACCSSGSRVRLFSHTLQIDVSIWYLNDSWQLAQVRSVGIEDPPTEWKHRHHQKYTSGRPSECIFSSIQLPKYEQCEQQQRGRFPPMRMTVSFLRAIDIAQLRECMYGLAQTEDSMYNIYTSMDILGVCIHIYIYIMNMGRTQAGTGIEQNDGGAVSQVQSGIHNIRTYSAIGDRTPNIPSSLVWHRVSFSLRGQRMVFGVCFCTGDRRPFPPFPPPALPALSARYPLRPFILMHHSL